MPASWESLWQGLLWEAAGRASSSRRNEPVLPQAAASVILARGAWESYFNEFIEWRRLSDLRNRPGLEALEPVHRELGLEFNDEEEEWSNLRILNTLRNKIVHHQAEPSQIGTGPWLLVETLVKRGVIAAAPAKVRSWEKIVLTKPTARWACLVTARSIIRLESIPTRRSRSLEEVRSAVEAALLPLGPLNLS